MGIRSQQHVAAARDLHRARGWRRAEPEREQRHQQSREPVESHGWHLQRADCGAHQAAPAEDYNLGGSPDGEDDVAGIANTPSSTSGFTRILSTFVTVCRAPYSFSIRWGMTRPSTVRKSEK